MWRRRWRRSRRSRRREREFAKSVSSAITKATACARSPPSCGGAAVEDNPDGIAIEPSTLSPAAIETYEDHRIAMSFAVAGLKLPGVRIKDPGCVSKTFPDFFDRLARLTA